MIISSVLSGKKGIEIGGPSQIFQTSGVYAMIGALDNVVFSDQTIWASFSNKVYNYYQPRDTSGCVSACIHGGSSTQGRQGKLFEMDAVDLSPIPDDSYDVVLSSHSLEHIANPLKALKEWIRIIKKGGHIVLILPEKSKCFDHKREHTKFPVLLDKFNRNVGEDSLDSLPEILRLHDLSLDLPAGNFEQFTKRSLNNFQNRCLHHHVFNLELIQSICEFFDIKLVYHQINGLDMWFILEC